MAPIVTWILVALVTAFLVMLVAGTTSGVARPGPRQFVRELRDGLRRRPDSGSVGLVRGARIELTQAADAEGSVDDLFRIGQTPARAYVDPVELAGPLAGPLAGATRRIRESVR